VAFLFCSKRYISRYLTLVQSECYLINHKRRRPRGIDDVSTTTGG